MSTELNTFFGVWQLRVQSVEELIKACGPTFGRTTRHWEQELTMCKALCLNDPTIFSRVNLASENLYKQTYTCQLTSVFPGEHVNRYLYCWLARYNLTTST